jgi:hypothetical protein
LWSLYTGVRGIRILRTSPFGISRKFAKCISSLDQAGGYPSGCPCPSVANIARKGGRPAEVRHVPDNKGLGCRGVDNLALDALPTVPLYEANRGGSAARSVVDVARGALTTAVLLRPWAGLRAPPFIMLALLAALFPTSYFYNAAFALLQRRVGEDEEPTRRPLRRPPSAHQSMNLSASKRVLKALQRTLTTLNHQGVRLGRQ